MARGGQFTWRLTAAPDRAAENPGPQGPVPALSPPEGGRSPTRPSTSAVCGVMRKLGPKAARIFLHLVDGLAPGEAKTIDNAGGAFMAVSIDCLQAARMAPDGEEAGALYAIAHRFEANGDLVPDPDVEFYVVTDPAEKAGKAIYPTAIDHPPPIGYRRYVEFGSDGLPDAIHRRGQADLARFCDTWIRNIAAQQGLVLR